MGTCRSKIWYGDSNIFYIDYKNYEFTALTQNLPIFAKVNSIGWRHCSVRCDYIKALWSTFPFVICYRVNLLKGGSLTSTIGFCLYNTPDSIHASYRLPFDADVVTIDLIFSLNNAHNVVVIPWILAKYSYIQWILISVCYLGYLVVTEVSLLFRKYKCFTNGKVDQPNWVPAIQNYCVIRIQSLPANQSFWQPHLWLLMIIKR